MRVLAPSLIALIAATPALADDFYAPAPVIAATVYAEGAVLTRRISVNLPAGDHRVVVPVSSETGLESLPRISANADIRIGAIGFEYERDVDPALLFTAAQRAAQDRIDALETEIEAQQDRINAARLQVQAVEAQRDFVTAIRPPESAATTEDLTALADLVRTQTETALRTILTGQQDMRGMEQALADLNADLAAATRALKRLGPPEPFNNLISIAVTLATAQEVQFELTDMSSYAGWRFDYEINLTEGAAPEITIDRKIFVYREDGDIWDSIDLTLSTATPTLPVAPFLPRPNKALVFAPRPVLRSEVQSTSGAVEPIVEAEPVVVVENAAPIFSGIYTEGVVATYVYPRKVTIGAYSPAQLALDTLRYPVTTEIHASPRHDDTAYLMARLENTTHEAILPGTANFYRAGHFVGRDEFALIPAGADDILPFGPIEGLRLNTVFARNETGDTGILTRSNTRDQAISFSVENLTGESQQLRAFYPLPFSEQEDLRVTVTASPRPDETDIDDKRGVSAWDMDLAPGETATVKIDVSMDWPEGQELRWYP